MATAVEDIRFYVMSDPYGEFSNFALYPIKVDGVLWPTVEHYFQAQKFDDKAYQDKIRNAPSPMKAAELGRSRRMKIVRKWDKQKDNIMYTALVAKFTQHSDLKELLLSTGDTRLIEYTENDSYWGDGGDGSGQNRLGKLLMTVRKNLLEKS